MTPNQTTTTSTPRSAPAASTGLGGSTVGQELGNKYYRGRFYNEALAAATVAGASNPGVPRLESMQSALAAIEAEAATRRAALAKQQDTAAQLRASKKVLLSRAASGRGGGNLLLDLLKLEQKIIEGQATEYETRVAEMGDSGRRKLASSFGSVGTLSASEKKAAQAIAGSIRSGDLAEMGPEQLQAFLSETAEGAVLSARTADSASATSQTQRLSKAAAMAEVLRDQGIDEAVAAQSIATVFNLSEATDGAGLLALTARGRQSVKDALSTNTLSELRSAEGYVAANQRLLNEVQGLKRGLTAAGPSRSQVFARAQLQKMQKNELTPDQKIILQDYLADLRDNGVIDDEDLKDKGQELYNHARKYKLYDPADAYLFDPAEIQKVARIAEDRAKMLVQQGEVLSRAERTGLEVQRDTAREFIRTVTAAEGLEQPIDPAMASSYYEQRVLGGAMDILSKEGKSVYDKGNPLDRDRRLGGTGRLKQRPHRVALRLFNQDSGQANFAANVQTIRDSMKDPERRRLAEAYLAAMYMQSNADNEGTGEAGTETQLPERLQQRANSVAAEREAVDAELSARQLGGASSGLGAGNTTVAPMVDAAAAPPPAGSAGASVDGSDPFANKFDLRNEALARLSAPRTPLSPNEVAVGADDPSINSETGAPGFMGGDFGKGLPMAGDPSYGRRPEASPEGSAGVDLLYRPRPVAVPPETAAPSNMDLLFRSRLPAVPPETAAPSNMDFLYRPSAVRFGHQGQRQVGRVEHDPARRFANQESPQQAVINLDQYATSDVATQVDPGPYGTIKASPREAVQVDPGPYGTFRAPLSFTPQTLTPKQMFLLRQFGEFDESEDVDEGLVNP